MKQLLKSITPTQLLSRLKKSRSDVSKSDPPSFASTASYFSSSSDSSSSSRAAPKPRRAATLPTRTRSDDWTSDREITRVELESVLRRVGATSDEEVAEMIKEIDRNGDGCISLDTVRSVFESDGAGEDELREAFDFFDVDHDGKITAEELQTAFGEERCTIEDCRRMIEGVDKNKDGFVCFEDFVRMMDLRRC